MRITQWGEYGVHFCAYIVCKHQEGISSVSASEIAKSQDLDLLYAQQILQRLRRSNLVQSVRGPLGGYKISKSACDITLYDILVPTESKL